LLVIPFKEQIDASAVLRSGIRRIQFEGLRYLLFGFIEKTNVVVDIAELMMGFSETRIE
jgi:hypothetical protein